MNNFDVRISLSSRKKCCITAFTFEFRIAHCVCVSRPDG